MKIMPMAIRNYKPLINRFTSFEVVNQLISDIKEDLGDFGKFNSALRQSQLFEIDKLLMIREKELIEDYIVDCYEVLGVSWDHEEQNEEEMLRDFAQSLFEQPHFNASEPTFDDKEYYDVVIEKVLDCVLSGIKNLLVETVQTNKSFNLSINSEEDFKQAVSILMACKINFKVE